MAEAVGLAGGLVQFVPATRKKDSYFDIIYLMTPRYGGFPPESKLGDEVRIIAHVEGGKRSRRLPGGGTRITQRRSTIGHDGQRGEYIEVPGWIGDRQQTPRMSRKQAEEMFDLTLSRGRGTLFVTTIPPRRSSR